MNKRRITTEKSRTAADASGAAAELGNDAAESSAPVDLTGQRPIFDHGAPVPLARTRSSLHWFQEHLPHLPSAKPEDSVRHHAYFDQSLESRERDKL
jgi:hypothetical protein